MPDTPVASIINASANAVNAGVNVASGIQARLERKQQQEQFEKNLKLQRDQFNEEKTNNAVNRKLSIRQLLESEKNGGAARNMSSKQDYRTVLQANNQRRRANAFMTGVKSAFANTGDNGANNAGSFSGNNTGKI
jgi:hypothetical protein